MGMAVEMPVTALIAVPLSERVMAQDDLCPALRHHGSHVVEARPVKFGADLVAVVVAKDQPLSPIEALEDRGCITERSIRYQIIANCSSEQNIGF